jgi:hypothetical protein
MNNQNLFKDSFPVLSITFGIGIFFIILGITVGWFARQQMNNLSQTEGTVVALKFFTSGKGSCKAPVVKYEVEGTTYQLQPESAYSCDFLASIINKKTVYYPANNPSEGKITNFGYYWFVPGLFMVIGSMFCFVSGFIFVAERKLEQKKLPENTR